MRGFVLLIFFLKEIAFLTSATPVLYGDLLPSSSILSTSTLRLFCNSILLSHQCRPRRYNLVSSQLTLFTLLTDGYQKEEQGGPICPTSMIRITHLVHVTISFLFLLLPK